MAVAANATEANMSAVSGWGTARSLRSPQGRLRQASGRSGRHDGGWTDAESLDKTNEAVLPVIQHGDVSVVS